ncbi:MAG: hypothetical protein JSV90_00640 [Methanobacteriota archaeon]|nr:MAG: hypothetical protein JSV90_00640 [Euryarchaeota archaeon]
MAEARKRKYNDEESLEELCRRYLACRDIDPGAAIEYCKGFLTVLEKKDVKAGAVLSSRSRLR